MKDVSSRCTHMGPAGAGLAAKMINQLIVGCTHAVLAEALLVAESAGIDAARIPECLAGGHADGTLLQRLYPRMAARDFAPQGYARQLLKDLEMVNEYAGALKAPVPMTGEALSLYRMLIHLGHAELDTSAVFKIYDRAITSKLSQLEEETDEASHHVRRSRLLPPSWPRRCSRTRR